MIPRKPFFYLRHGETDHNAKQILSGGDCDVPLNDCGIKQAQKIRPYIEGLPIQVIYHSPLTRAKQTMETVSQNLKVKQVEIEQLRECEITVWLDMNRMANKIKPVSDGTKSFFNQVKAGMLHILESNTLPLIVAHGGVHFALCHLLAIENHSKAIGNCALVHFNPIGETSWTAKIVHS